MQQYWLIRESGLTIPAYCDQHDVLDPWETSLADAPPADTARIRELDEQAFDSAIPWNLAGKWIVQTANESVDSLWESVSDLVDSNEIIQTKVATEHGRREYGAEKHAIIVYTPNYFDMSDVRRVRDLLTEYVGVERKLPYKPEYYTHKGIYPETAEAAGLEQAHRFEF